ncbi:MAG: glycosyltransferase family 4 protein, partial [Planctomycetota bacterium]
ETFLPEKSEALADQDLVFVGRLVNNKGLLPIVDALKVLKERNGEAPTLLIVGRGPMRNVLEQRLEAADLRSRVRFIDWVDGPEDLAEIYRRSRVLVCASTCEGGPRVTVEAMACGTPVISTPVGVMTGLLEDGRAGKLCGFDAASIADGVDEVLSDEPARRTMGEEAHALAQSFEYAATLRGYATGLQRLAGEPEGLAGETPE